MEWIRQKLLTWLGRPSRKGNEEAWLLQLAHLKAELAQLRARMDLVEMTPPPAQATVTFTEEGRLADLPDAHLGAQ